MLIGHQASEPDQRPVVQDVEHRGAELTDETEARLGQVRPLEDGVEDVLSFTVQLVQLIQDQEPEDGRRQRINDPVQAAGARLGRPVQISQSGLFLQPSDRKPLVRDVQERVGLLTQLVPAPP